MLVVDSTVWVDYLNGVVNPQTDYLGHISWTTGLEENVRRLQTARL
ncbi:MAG: hypothetical protein NZ765_02165 [Anaerolineae bacterium]|nr:hypothetical protein [Anaerolineae bacterium]MDW8072288.1 hypothetical protein [Anaerolineae bacterium]